MKKHRIFALCLAGILQFGFTGLYASPSEVQLVAQQSLTIKGIVSDFGGEPLIGVNAVSYTHLTLPTIA